MKTDYTPGPWAHSVKDWSVVADGRTICQIPHHDVAGIRDAHLIAAAPDLLEALQLMLKQFTKTPSSLKDTEARGKAHAAIAKVTGVQS